MRATVTLAIVGLVLSAWALSTPQSAAAAPPTTATCEDAAAAVMAHLGDSGLVSEEIAERVAVDVLRLCQENAWEDASQEQIFVDILDCLDGPPGPFPSECDTEAWFDTFGQGVEEDVTLEEIRDVLLPYTSNCSTASDVVENFLLTRRVPEQASAFVSFDVFVLCSANGWDTALPEQILADLTACATDEDVCVTEHWTVALNSGINDPGVPLEDIAEVIARTFSLSAVGRPFGDLPTPPDDKGGKPAFVTDVICDAVESMVSSKGPKIPNCQ